jgi:phosphatidate cytidylyltransferase
MLKLRVITAIVLLAVLLPIIFSGSSLAFLVVASLFLAAAMWENQRLFQKQLPIPIALAWTGMFLFLMLNNSQFSKPTLFYVAMLFWMFGLIPGLRFGLPKVTHYASGLLSGMYGVAIFACFVALSELFVRSPMLMLSAMAVVWVADIGAYFVGKTIGKTKLAPSISPGKTWEGAIGGAVAVLVLGFVCVYTPALSTTFPALLMHNMGMINFLFILILLSVASIVGDLFESLLKRRVGFKDSSSLLPGHGGVLDRIDALIPSMPVVALLVSNWKW